MAILTHTRVLAFNGCCELLLLELVNHLLYSPDIALSDIHLFANIKKTNFIWLGSSEDDVIAGASDISNQQDQSCFTNGLQVLQQTCVGRKGDYIEK